MLMTIDLPDLEYGVVDGHIMGEDGNRVEVKMLTLGDRKSGISVQVALPCEPPPGVEVPDGFMPPAQDLAARLGAKVSKVEVARSMPSRPRNGKRR